MARTPINATSDWSTSNRYLASGSTAIRVSNPQDQQRLYFAISTSPSVPAFAVKEASFIEAGQVDRMTLEGGEYIYFACFEDAIVPVEV